MSPTYMNEILIYGLITILLMSNIVFVLLYIRERKHPTKKQSNSGELTEFISDLVQGEAVVRITRIAPNDVFLRSPRHGRQ